MAVDAQCPGAGLRRRPRLRLPACAFDLHALVNTGEIDALGHKEGNQP